MPRGGFVSEADLASSSAKRRRMRLRTEADTNAASALHKLLLDEEDELGFDLEQLGKIERETADRRRRIEVMLCWAQR